MPHVIHLSLPDIHCINCVRPIEHTLNESTTPAIVSFNIDIIEKKLRIVVDDHRPKEVIITQIRQMLDDIGVTTRVLKGPNVPPPDTSRAHWIQGIIGLLSGAALVALSISGLVLPFGAMVAMTGLATLLTLFLGRASYRDTLTAFRRSKNLTMDTLFSVSTLTVLAISITGLFVPWLPVMPAAGLLIFGFRHIGKLIEASITKKIVSGLSFKDSAALWVEKQTTRDQTTVWEKVRSADLKANDIIRISPGQTLPVDGVCLSAQAHIDQSYLNGDLRATVRKGAELVSGVKSLENNEKIVIRVTRCVESSHLAIMDEKLSQALGTRDKAPIESTTDTILQYFVPTILILSAVSAVVTGLLAGPAMAVQCAASLLVSACPCTLGLITPLAMKIGMSKAMKKYGILFSNPAALEHAGKIDAVIFDLTGTLTTGTPRVSVFQPIVQDNQEETKKIVAYAAALEKDSRHPVGREIFRFVTEEEKAYDPHYPIDIESYDTSHHAGIRAVINGDDCRMGNAHYMADHGLILPYDQSDVSHAEQTIYLAVNGTIRGQFILKDDPLREKADFAVQALRRMGKTVYICTGSDEHTARKAASALNIPADRVFFGCDMETKSKHVLALKQKHGRVAMIGDGGNDSLAMTKSDFSMALYSAAGHTPTQDHASATACGKSLLPVVAAFAIAEQTIKNIKQNLFMSFIYNAVTAAIAGGALLAIGMTISPPVGAALMVVQMLLLLANQERIRRQNPVPLTEAHHAHTKSHTTHGLLRRWGLINSPTASPRHAARDNLLRHNVIDIDSSPPVIAAEAADCKKDEEFGIMEGRKSFRPLTS